MMTSDERHEMAERLRALLDDDLDFDDPRSDVSLTEVEVALRLLGGFYDNSTKAEYVQHLADLIDRPTCSIKRESRNGYPTTWGVCSRCGAIVNAERAVSNATEYLPTRYCPNCGAEVVNDD